MNIEIERVKAWFYQQLEFIKSYPSESHRLILILSVIDSFVQDYSNFTRKENRKNFIKFIQTYSTQYCDILKALCPVTLYYAYFDNRDDLSLQLQHRRIYSAGSPETIEEAKRLLKQIPKTQQGKAQLDHSYAGLVYQLRNKLVHEFTSLNMPLNFQCELDVQLPHMASESRIENGKLVFYRWALGIPEKFVKDVAVDAVEHYLQDCLMQNHIPFGSIDRKCFMAWYD